MKINFAVVVVKKKRCCIISSRKDYSVSII